MIAMTPGNCRQLSNALYGLNVVPGTEVQVKEVPVEGEPVKEVPKSNARKAPLQARLSRRGWYSAREALANLKNRQ